MPSDDEVRIPLNQVPRLPDSDNYDNMADKEIWDARPIHRERNLMDVPFLEFPPLTQWPGSPTWVERGQRHRCRQRPMLWNPLISRRPCIWQAAGKGMDSQM